MNNVKNCEANHCVVGYSHGDEHKDFVVLENDTWLNKSFAYEDTNDRYDNQLADRHRQNSTDGQCAPLV